jgi:hypothetical protein
MVAGGGGSGGCPTGAGYSGGGGGGGGEYKEMRLMRPQVLASAQVSVPAPFTAVNAIQQNQISSLQTQVSNVETQVNNVQNQVTGASPRPSLPASARGCATSCRTAPTSRTIRPILQLRANHHRAFDLRAP